MLIKKTFNFINNIEEYTSCDIFFSNNNKNKKSPFVLFLHGFRAFKEWGFFPYFAERLAEVNFITGCLGFSLNTITNKNTQWFDMDRFRRNTVTQMITEVELFINQLNENFLFDSQIETFWNNEIYIIGHSLGGALAIVLTSKLNNANSNKIIKKLVSICSIYDFDVYTEKQKQHWFKTKTKEFIDKTTGQNIILNLEFLTDRLTYTDKKSVLSMVSRLTIPYYILHTAADATVSPKAANILASAVSSPTLFIKEIIPKGNHLLNSTHPFENSNPVLECVIRKVINFFIMK